VSTASTVGVLLNGLRLATLAACAMARLGVQAPRRDICVEGDGFLCPFEGCQYQGNSMRGLNVHLGMVEHHGNLRRDEASGDSRECSSAFSQSSLSEVSSSSSDSSMAASHSGHDYDDGGLDAVESQHSREEAQSQSQLSLADDEDYSQSDADSDAHGMDIPLGHVAADNVPESSHSIGAQNSSAAHSDHALERPDAGLAAPASARRVTETDMRLHDILNGLPLQRQQHIIDFLQDPALELSAISASSARRLRKDVKALCKQVRAARAYPNQCCFGRHSPQPCKSCLSQLHDGLAVPQTGGLHGCTSVYLPMQSSPTSSMSRLCYAAGLAGGAGWGV